MAQVKYKGKVIADISKGQKLTLCVDGYELEGNIVIDGFNTGEDVPEWNIADHTITKGGNE